MKAIQFEKVSFSYENESLEQGADSVFGLGSAFSLEDLSFSVEEGEFVAVLGHNGSGKSTLARLTNGLLSANAGNITVFGMDATKESNLFEVRKSVGIVFQNPDNQTVASIVEDDVAFGPENIGVEREEIGRRIDFALKAVGMEKYRHSTTTRLSGGQKQRIAIAGVLALKPRVMILDEATAMLDPRGRKEVMDVVLRLNKEEKITVLFITHFPEEALLADRVIVMDHGKIIMDGKPFEVLKEENKLRQSSLALPKAMKISRALQKNGVDIPDCFDENELSTALLQRLDRGKYALSVEKQAQTNTDESGKIVCKDLSFTYNSASPFATHALNGVSLTIPSGEFFGIIGHTGSGKSTFVQHLNALIKLPTAEKKYKEKKNKKTPQTPKPTLTVGGFDLTDKTTDFRALRKKVGMVFQYPEYQLFAETVFEDVAFGLKNFSDTLTSEEVENAVRDAVQTVGLDYDSIKTRSPFELSGGQRRRVALAGVIVTKPEILILDEPGAGLDPLGKEEILSLLHTIHEKWCKTVIIVSHDMDEVAENCTGVAIFSNGQILASETPKTLFSSQELADKAGLDLPFTQKVLQLLATNGIEICCGLKMEEFVQAVTTLVKGGENNA